MQNVIQINSKVIRPDAAVKTVKSALVDAIQQGRIDAWRHNNDGTWTINGTISMSQAQVEGFAMGLRF